ncbi:MAG: hypothetical protein V4529_16865 [Gemmatimonadota bacterium]
MSPTDKILDKLSKLKASREGEAALGNSAAAEAFAEAISRLLLQHELSEADIPIGGVKDEPIVEQLVDLSAYGIKRNHARIGWQEALARIVAPAHLCRFLVHSGSNFITFVGTREHVVVAEYAYGVLAAAADRMSFAAREQWWKDECGGQHLESNGFRASWLSGFVQRIAERFREARKREVEQAANSSTALMRLDGVLARAQRHVDEKYKRKTAAASTGGANAAGYRAGRDAADSMKIGQRGVGSNNSKQIGGK